MSSPKRCSLSIEPFKHREEAVPECAEKAWDILRHAINEIYDQNTVSLSFENLYMCAFLVQSFGTLS